MAKKYNIKPQEVSMASEPAAVAYQAEPAMTSISVRVPQKDIMLAQEMIHRMGWVVDDPHAEHDYTHSLHAVKDKSFPSDWRTMAISPAVEALTFAKRVDLGTSDYKELLTETLEEKYLK